VISRRALFLCTHHRNGRPRYLVGHHYPLTAETLSLIAAGTARETVVHVNIISYLAHRLEQASAERRLQRERAASIAAEQRT
jgi:hypothetical protein